jgi:glucose-6-phosphate 1-dehydrogenase
VLDVFGESQVYRIDHHLGSATLLIRRDEFEAAWALVTPIMDDRTYALMG